MTYTPAPRKTYKGSITNTDRWERVTPRPGDVHVCTPPKCGTTWTTSIVTMLCRNATDIAPQMLVHWVDAEIVPIDEVAAGLEAAPGRRCIKTHTPMDGIPWRADAHYIAVYRHPVDMYLSLRKHLQNEIDTANNHPYLTAPDDGLLAFVDSDLAPDDFDTDCLATFVTHFRSYVRAPRPDNLLLLHYADMLADPGTAIARIAAHIGLDPAPAFLEEVRDATSFGNMKADPGRFAPYADKGYWHDPKAFFHSAGTRKWEGRISERALAHYAAAMAASLTPAEVAWVENGASAGDI
jgi:hypothetical protein